MNIYLLVAGALCVLMAIAHSVLGERLILVPLQKVDGLPAVRGSARATKSTLRFTWHVTSVLGLGFAALLFHYATAGELRPDQVTVLRSLTLTFLVCFAVAIVGSRARHLSWLVFLSVSILTWIGAT